jgi:hypothetical protein
VELACSRINDTAGRILKTVLTASATSQSSESKITAAQILHQITIKTLPMDHVVYVADDTQRMRDYLELLHQAEFLSHDSSHDTFALPDQVSRELSMQTSWLMRYILSRFGKVSARLFRALLLRGKMEEKQLATVTMVPAHQARNALYAMHSAGMIVLTTVPRSADRAPARSFFIFSVDHAFACITSREALLHAICNATERWKAVKQLSDADDAHLAARQRAAKRSAALKSISGEMEDISMEPIAGLEKNELELSLEKRKLGVERLKLALLRIDSDLLYFL